MVEGLKKEHPVQPQEKAAEQQLRGPGLQPVPVEGDMAPLHQHQQSQTPQGGPEKGQRHRAQRDEPAHQTDGAENGQRQEHLPPGREK